MSIRLFNNSGGYIDLNAGGDGTAANTFTLPAETGTLLTSASNANFPAGSVLQVVANTITSSGSFGGGSWQTILSASITPSNASNKILVMATTMMAHLEGTALECGARLFNGTSAVVQGNANSAATRTFVNSTLLATEAYNSFCPTMIAIETAGTTSSKTYSVQGYGSEGQGFYYNRTPSLGEGDYTFSGATTITLMEIAA
jgi:hypothetical protein